MAAGPTVKQLLQTYPDKIRLVVKNYPYKYRDFSKISAEASLAAREQGKYWEMHDILIARSPKLDRASLIAYAGELGLDVAKFTEAIDSGRHAKDVEADVQLAESIDLYNTPTFYINGRQVVGERPFDYFKKIIDEELNQAGR
ncbi:thioredoxin domain-containing protein [Desulfoprunum benzoelyticum]|uniref:Protein-disulfide isomerase n=1 Tax=Desulfoprunum benzoelyticum TaxID=1506996 RepID=A0A840V0Y0_9BACT|nr:protein-disulfide isomerase [Desulfoprunum benzoelyticum]MBM9529189.1 thioredoxin domain-containing protein [Desulfoprunum benzoelyticum]